MPDIFDQAAQANAQPPQPAQAPTSPAGPTPTGDIFDQAAQANAVPPATSTPPTGPTDAQTVSAAMGDNSLMTGVNKGIGETAHTLGAAAGYLMPKGMRDRLALPTSFTQPGYLQSENGAETAGKVGESIAEFALGDEALKGLQMSEKLGIAQKLASMAKGSPYIARMLELGMNALRGGIATVPQQMVHGATPAEALKTGAAATVLGAGTGAAIEGASALADTPVGQAVKNVLHGGQPGLQTGIHDAAQTATEQAEARSAALKATEPVRVHPPEIDPAVKDHARLNPFPPEEVKIKEFPGVEAEEGKPAEHPTTRITGPNGSSIELEMDGKTARVKGIVNSGALGDGQRLYDNAIAWAKDSGFDSLEGDKTQTTAGKTAWQRISERHNARMTGGTPSIDLTGSRPAGALPAPAAPTAPAAGVRTSVEDVSNAVKAKSQGIYKQLDEVSGGRWQRYDDALKNVQDKMDEVNGVDDDAYDRLETKRNDIETSQAQMLEDMKGKGLDPGAADAAVAHYKQAMALRDLDKAVKGATTGDVRVGGTENVNPKMFTARIQKLYDSGRLKQALGNDGADKLLKEAYSAKTTQDVRKWTIRVGLAAAAYVGLQGHVAGVAHEVAGAL
jgi:hypothetical protein